MNIQDRLRHCAKHTGLDAVVELLTEAAAHIEGLNSIPKVQGGEPVPFLLNGTRFKMSFQTDLDADLDPITTLTCFNNFQNQLDGRWVALVAAEDDVHLKLSTPQPAQATQAEVTDEQRQAVDQIMEQAQVFASAWALVGGRFDSGDALEDAIEAKEELSEIVFRAILALRPAAVPMTDEQRVVVSFLLGEGDLNGASFGDPNNPTHGGQFWWRKYLRNAFGITAQAKKEGV